MRSVIDLEKLAWFKLKAQNDLFRASYEQMKATEQFKNHWLQFEKTQAEFDRLIARVHDELFLNQN